MRTCVWCTEPIEAGERCWRFANGPLAHRVCALRQVIGSVAHLERRCSCYVPGADEGDPEGLTRREAAGAAVTAWMRQEEGSHA
jgi:hypothetical protein